MDQAHHRRQAEAAPRSVETEKTGDVAMYHDAVLSDCRTREGIQLASAVGDGQVGEEKLDQHAGQATDDRRLARSVARQHVSCSEQDDPAGGPIAGRQLAGPGRRPRDRAAGSRPGRRCDPGRDKSGCFADLVALAPEARERSRNIFQVQAESEGDEVLDALRRKEAAERLIAQGEGAEPRGARLRRIRHDCAWARAVGGWVGVVKVRGGSEERHCVASTLPNHRHQPQPPQPPTSIPPDFAHVAEDTGWRRHSTDARKRRNASLRLRQSHHDCAWARAVGSGRGCGEGPRGPEGSSVRLPCFFLLLV